MYKYILILLILLIALSVFRCKKWKETTNSNSVNHNLIVLDKEFKFFGQDKSRKIRIYLPDNYWKVDQKYPVLYMHDGQNLFNDPRSNEENWNINESLDQLSKSTNFKLIVVGIDNGNRRINEFSPWDNKKYGKAEGKEYMEFIVKELKRFIDKTYRTFPERQNTAIMGSSMGGFISHYAIYKYPEIFSKAGMISASYWYSDEVYNFTLNNPVPKDTRLYIIAGEKEGYDNVLPNHEKIFKTILNTKPLKENINFIIDPEGKHHVNSWKRQFIPAVKWLFSQ